MADIYKSVHENQLRNRLQILHVIDVDSANISKAFATDIKKAKDSAKEEKIRKVMKEFKEGTLKSSSGELVTDRKQAIAIAISEADNIEKSDDADSDSSEEPIEKAQKANIGDIHIWGGKRYKKIGEGKWVEVSESHGMTKDEHIYNKLDSRSVHDNPKGLVGENFKKYHRVIASKLSDKEYTDEEIGADSDHKQGTQKWRKEIIGQGQDAHLITLKMHFPEETVAKFKIMEIGDSGVFKDKDGNSHYVSREGKDIWYLGNKREDIQKSVFDEIQENIEKSLNSISTKVSEQIFDDIEKSVNHKYFKREGTPGNYKYYYTESDYKNKKEMSPDERDIIEFDEEHEEKVVNDKQDNSREGDDVKDKREEMFIIARKIIDSSNYEVSELVRDFDKDKSKILANKDYLKGWISARGLSNGHLIIPYLQFLLDLHNSGNEKFKHK